MQNFSNKNSDNDSKQPVAPKKTTSNPLLGKLDLIGSIIMILGLFIGQFYKADGGAYSVTYGAPGYRLIFNSDMIMGTLLILLPAIVLITDFVPGLKKYDKLIKFALPIVTFILVFVLKGQAGDELTSGDEGAKLAIGGWIYLLGNLAALAAGASKFFGFDLEEKISQIKK